MPHGDWGPMEKTHWVPFRNDSAETIPPFAVIRITGTVTIHGRTVFKGAKPNATSQTWYAINGAVNVASGKIGECTFTPQAIVRYSGGTPTYGDVAGPTNGSWNLSTSGTGFTILGSYSTTRALTLVEAIQVPAASTSTSVQVWATASRATQSVASNTSDEVFTDWDVHGDSGNVTRNTTDWRFKAEIAGFYNHHISLNAAPASGGTSGYEILTDLTVEASFNDASLGSGSSVTLGIIDLDGDSTIRPRRNFSALAGWVLDVDDEVWMQFTTGAEDVTLTQIRMEMWLASEHTQ